MLKTVLFIPVILFYTNVFSQTDNDSLLTENPYEHVTKRAAILSAIVPGSGQIYNEFGYRKIPQKKHRAWWKVPLIYGGLGACGYYFYQNNKMAGLTKQEWQMRSTDTSLTYFDQRFENNSLDQLISGNGESQLGFDKYSKRRDIFVFAFIGVWGLNVLDAYVDAHFVTFDVSEDLSLSWSPTVIGYRHPGINLQFNFN